MAGLQQDPEILERRKRHQLRPGQVGWQIARQLSGEKNDVTIVDTNADLIRRATEVLDVQGVVGFASHPDVLAKAGAPSGREFSGSCC